jgi:5,10-methylenetetrahydromethanopterin reductase
MMSLGVCGTPDEVTERCHRLVAAGATHLSFGPPLGADRAAAIRLLGERVVPALRRGE